MLIGAGNIGFCRRATRPSQSPCEIEEIETKGEKGETIVPAFLVTASFFVDKPRHVWDIGDLVISNSSHGADKIIYKKKAGKCRRHKSDDSCDDPSNMNDDNDNDNDDADDGGGKPTATPKKAGLASGLFSFLTFGTCGQSIEQQQIERQQRDECHGGNASEMALTKAEGTTIVATMFELVRRGVNHEHRPTPKGNSGRRISPRP